VYQEKDEEQKVAIAVKSRINQLPGYTRMGVRIGEGTTLLIRSGLHRMSDYSIDYTEALYQDTDGTFKTVTLTSDGHFDGRATVDATPEVEAAYRTHLYEIERDRRERENKHTARSWAWRFDGRGQIEKGDWVQVRRGRKVPQGTIGRVKWIGIGQYGERVGLATADSKELVYTASKNVDKIALPPEEIAQIIRRRDEAFRNRVRPGRPQTVEVATS
jgi:hypothetical protein